MAFRILFTPLPNSHPFYERECPLDQPLKIGRAVAKFKSSQDNLIFDCKVLSRNHALLWEDGGKFYLKDMKSSNGTFVNRQRLSRSGEESGPVEIKAGDELQFGVDVIEVKKVTHSCIIGTFTFISLDHPSATATIAKLETVSSRDLVELSQLLRVMREREQSLATKMANIQDTVTTMESQTDHGFQMLLTEDQLLSRVEVLENQLQLYCESYSGDELRHQLSELLDQKMQYELKSKESLRKVLQEKLEYASRLSEIQRNYDQSEEECEKLRIMFEEAQRGAEHVAGVLKTKENEMAVLQTELSGAQTSLAALKEQTDAEKAQLEEQVAHLTGQESKLTVQVESLQAEVDFSKEQLSATRGKLQGLKASTEKSTVGVQACVESYSTGVQTESASMDERSTQTTLQTFDDRGVQTEPYCAQAEARDECTVSDTTTLTATPVIERFEVQKTAMLHSELPDEDLQSVSDDSDENVLLQRKLADVEARVLEMETAKRGLMAQVQELEFKLREAESSSAASTDISQTLDQVWKQLNDSKEQNKRLQATLSQQRSDVETVRNQLKAEHDALSREKAEREQMTRKNRILIIQLAELQEQSQNLEEKHSTAEAARNLEGQMSEKRQRQRELLQKHLSNLNRKVKEKDDRIGVLQNQLKDLKSRPPHVHVSSEMAVMLGIAAAVLAWLGLYIISWMS